MLLGVHNADAIVTNQYQIHAKNHARVDFYDTYSWSKNRNDLMRRASANQPSQRTLCGDTIMHSANNWTSGLTVVLCLVVTGPAAANDPVAPAAAPSSLQVEQPPASGPLSTADIVRQQLAEPSRNNADRDDRAALAAFYAEAGETLLWVAPSGFSARGLSAIAEIAKAADWGLQPTAYVVPPAPAANATSDALAAMEIQLSMAVVKYARHARSGRFDPTQLGRNFDQKPPITNPKAVLQALAASNDAATVLRGMHPRHPQFELLRQALLTARAAKDSGSQEIVQDADRPADAKKGRLKAATPATSASTIQRLVVNMEKWRWMPEELGDFHIWDNIPEYRMRVQKAGATIHSESIIVGKPNTPTPMFSANMQFVIFHPTWGVPDGIKMNEIAPALRRSSSSYFWEDNSEPAILRRHNLRVSQNGRPVNPATVNWSTVDVRSFQFTQPASASNVLGVVKFRFPNKHDVYMHDTPERSLFSRAEKAFSHGCMRVQNPRKLAEVILAEDRGWTSAQVGNAIAAGATQDVTLQKPTPVHVTYFTAMAEPDGTIKTFGDIYGHDNRVASVLEGKSVLLVAQSDATPKPVREARKSPQKRVAAGGGGDWLSGLFGN